MAYDPQAKRQRPKPTPSGPAPVDALLLTGISESSGRSADADRSGSGASQNGTEDSGVAHDQSPTPAVTPEPANPPPDKLLLNSALVSALGALVGALVLRCLWKRWFRNSGPSMPAPRRWFDRSAANRA